jgi:hypothetical protein
MSVVNVEYVGVTPHVNLPASFSPGTLAVDCNFILGPYGLQPRQSISAIHCSPVIAQRAVAGAQKFLQLYVDVNGKFTV